MLDVFEVGAIAHQKTNTSSSPIDRRTEKCRRTLLIFLSRPATLIVPVGLPLIHPSSLSLCCYALTYKVQLLSMEFKVVTLSGYSEVCKPTLTSLGITYSFPSLRGSHKKEEYLNETNCLEMMDE